MQIPTPTKTALLECFESITEKLEMDFESGYETEVTEVAHESCEGFIPFTNGGYDLTIPVTLMDLSSKGALPVNADISKQIEDVIEYSYKMALEGFVEDNAEIVKKLFPNMDTKKPDADIINYHTLYEMDQGELAEELSEFEYSYLTEGSTLFIQVKAFFFDKENSRNITGNDEIYFHAGYNLDFDYGRDRGLELSYERTIKAYELTPQRIVELFKNIYESI